MSKELPSIENYGLKAQMCRAAVSIPSNIAEGAAHGSSANFIRYLYNSMGSLSELETQTMLVKRIYDIQDDYIEGEMEHIRKMLAGLIKHEKLRTTDNR
jgi:four helix bundle protein